MKKSILIFSISLIMILVAGCKTGSKASASKESLTTSKWELSSIGGKSATAKEYSKGLPEAIFTADSKISGNSGCNRYGGSYTLDAEGNLTISQLISTKMFCQGVNEDEYIKALTRANRAKIEGKNLILYYENEQVLVFVPKELK